MGIVFLLILWPIILVVGIFELILPYIPYIILISAIFWLTVGLILNHIFKKHELYKAGKESSRKWINVLSDLLKWAVRIDIYGNIFLIIASIILAIVFGIKGIVPFL